jgi:hypothetical protein
MVKAVMAPAVPRSRRLALVVFAVLWGLITHGTAAGTGDEPHYEIIAHSIAFDRDIDVTGDYGDLRNRALGGVFEAGTHAAPGKDGRLRPVHDVGLPLLFAPYYAVAYAATGQIIARVPPRWLERARLNYTVLLRHFLSLAMIGFTVAIAVRLLALCSALAPDGHRPFWWVLLLVLSPPILSHSFLFFTEILSALLALAIFMWLRSAPTSRAAALLAGAALGYMLIVHARNVGLIAGLLLLALHEARGWRDHGVIIAFLGGAAALFAVRTGITYHFWGTWLTTPHERFGEAAGVRPLVTESVTRLAGWLFDQEHGLLPYAPIYLLVPAGWVALWKRDRPLCLAISLVVGAYVAVMTAPQLNAHGWRGGWTPAGRFLVPVAPFLAALVFSAVAHRRRVPMLVWVIVAVQLGIDVIVWQHPRLLWNDGIGTSALLNFLDGGTRRLSAYAPSIFPPIGGRTIAAVAVVAACWALVTAWLIRTAPAAEHASA